MRGRAVVVAGCLMVLEGALAGCGIGTQSSPQVVSRTDVPFGLMDRAPTTTTIPVVSEDVTVFFQGADRLVAASRAVPRPATPQEVLAALARGPTTAESAGGWRSPISTAVPLTILDEDDSTVTVRLPGSFTRLGGQDQIVAAAQLVFTLTAFASIDQVVVHIGHEVASIPTANGALTKDPLTTADYAALAPQ